MRGRWLYVGGFVAALMILAAVVAHLAMPRPTLPREWSVRWPSPDGRDGVRQLAFTPDGARVVALSIHGRVRLLNATDGKSSAGFEDVADADAIAVDPHGKWLAIGFERDVVLRPLDGGAETRRFTVPTDVRDLNVSADGSRILIFSSGLTNVATDGVFEMKQRSAAILKDVTTGETIWSRGEELDIDMDGAALSPSGRRVAISDKTTHTGMLRPEDTLRFSSRRPSQLPILGTQFSVEPVDRAEQFVSCEESRNRF